MKGSPMPSRNRRLQRRYAAASWRVRYRAGVAACGNSRMALEECGREGGDCGAGVEKSGGNCPETGDDSCRNCEGFVRAGMTFKCFKADRDVWFRANSSTLFQYRL